LAFALLTTPFCGCAGVWDEVTSKEFHVKALFTKTDPIAVLQESRDGDKRAAAYRALGDVDEYTGAEREQILEILGKAATQERQFLCRIAAIDALGHYQEPQAVTALTQAFYSAATFPADHAARLQMQAVTALGKTGSPQAKDFLIVVMNDRPKVEGSEQERQLVLDVRLAATRSLGGFNDPRSVEALQTVLRTERDVAMRDCARLALKETKGENTWFNEVQDLGTKLVGGKTREQEEIELVGAPPVRPSAHRDGQFPPR
jgi:HEAT repeat protein